MAMQDQERCSPPLVTARTASDEPQVPGSVASMATGDMVGGGGAGEEERGPEVGARGAGSSHTFDCPKFKRKPRSHVPRAALFHRWSLKIPVLPPAPAPDNGKDTPEKRCLHCGITWTLQWRMGPAGESTLCNACGVRYRQGRLVPEYRPRASPTFNQSEHSNKHREVLKIRKKHNDPAPAAAFKAIRTRKRRKGNGQQQPAQVRKKKGNKAQNLLSCPAPELPRAADDTDTMAQHLPSPPAQPHADGELMTDEPLPPPDPFLFDGPAAPMLIEDDEPVVIVIDDD